MRKEHHVKDRIIIKATTITHGLPTQYAFKLGTVNNENKKQAKQRHMRISRERSILNVESQHSFMTSRTHTNEVCVRSCLCRFGYVICDMWYTLKLVYTNVNVYVLCAECWVSECCNWMVNGFCVMFERDVCCCKKPFTHPK